jgi:geranylgeranyl diphosphate synthase type II
MSLTLARFAELEDLENVEVAIDEFFADRIERAARSGEGYRGLWQAARDAGSGGKKIRPALVVATHRALRGDDPRAAIQVATAFELLHTAFLLHDDVIDGDLIRRGRPNLAGARVIEAVDRGVPADRAAAWGQASAILAGDLLIHAAQTLVARISGPEDRRLALLELLDHCVFVTAAGELADVAYGSGAEDAALPDSLAMTQSKTASYTFEGPLAAGAILAGAAPEIVAGLAEFGRVIGTAFQLRDDLLGAFGAEGETGKSSVNDFRNRKLTPLVSFARTTTRGEELDRLLDAEVFDAEAVDEIRALLVECGARRYIEDLISAHVRQSVEVIEDSPFPVSLRVPLRRIVIEATERLQ